MEYGCFSMLAGRTPTCADGECLKHIPTSLCGTSQALSRALGMTSNAGEPVTVWGGSLSQSQ